MGNEFLNHDVRWCTKLLMFIQPCSHFQIIYHWRKKMRCTPLVLVIYLIKYFFFLNIWFKFGVHAVHKTQKAIWSEPILWTYFHNTHKCNLKRCIPMQCNSVLSFSISLMLLFISMCAVCNWVCTHYYVNYVAFDLLGRYIRSTCGDCVYCWCGFFTFHWCNTMQNPNAIVRLNTEPIATSVPNVQWKSIKYFYWEFIYFFFLSLRLPLRFSPLKLSPSLIWVKIL